MHNPKYKRYLYAISLFLLTTIASLWSWNTLSGMFGLPQVQYRHVLAAFVLLLILKWVFSASHRTISCESGGHHELSNH